MYTETRITELSRLFNESFEYAIIETTPKGTVTIGYCNESDNPEEQVAKMNLKSNAALYTYVKNKYYSPDKALQFVNIVAGLLRELGPSILNSISLADLALQYARSTVI